MLRVMISSKRMLELRRVSKSYGQGTHDAHLASWADRVVFLRDGRMTDQTAPAAGPETLLAPGDAR